MSQTLPEKLRYRALGRSPGCVPLKVQAQGTLASGNDSGHDLALPASNIDSESEDKRQTEIPTGVGRKQGPGGGRQSTI